LPGSPRPPGPPPRGPPAPPAPEQAGNLGPGADLPTRGIQGALQRRGERARVDLLLRRPDPGSHRRVQGWLELPAPAPGEPFDSEAEPSLELAQMLEGLELVPVEGDEEGAGRRRLQRAPPGGCQVPGKGGIGRG